MMRAYRAWLDRRDALSRDRRNAAIDLDIALVACDEMRAAVREVTR